MNIVAFVNHNSYAIVAVGVLIFVGWRILRGRPTWMRVGLLAALAVLLVLPPLYVRSGGAHTADALDAALASGRPTLLEVYSPF